MAKVSPNSDVFATSYPHIARLVLEEEGWIEVGQDHYSFSFIRVLYGGGMIWEGEPSYPSIDEAFQAADAATATWLQVNRPEPSTQPNFKIQKSQRKKGPTKPKK